MTAIRLPVWSACACLAFTLSLQAESLLAYYPFEGDYEDGSGNSTTATPSENPDQLNFVAGFRGQSLDVNDPDANPNSGGKVNIAVDANPAALPEVTFGGWVNIEGTEFDGFMAMDNGGWDRGIAINAQSTDAFGVVSGAAPVPGGLITRGSWQYVVGSFSKVTGESRIYVGDDAAGNQSTQLSIGSDLAGAGEPVIELGRYDNQDLDGVVDDIFVFDGALSAAKVNAIRNLRLSALDYSPAEAAELFALFDAGNSGTVGASSWSPRAGLPRQPGALVDLGVDGTGVVLDADGNGMAASTGIDLDTDDDGLSDWWENANFGDLSPDGTADPDSDGLTDAGEFAAGTDPAAIDSDGDSLSDGEEVNTLGTDPLNVDTDGDGITDDDEILLGSDPNDPLSIPSDTLLAFYAFEDNYEDGSVNGTVAGPAENPDQLTFVDGFRGRSLDINDPDAGGNTGGRVDIQLNVNPSVLAEVTFGGWVNVEGTEFDGFMATDNGGWDRGIAINTPQPDPNADAFAVVSGATPVLGAPVNRGSWQYVVSSFSKITGETRIYVGDDSAANQQAAMSIGADLAGEGVPVIELGRYDNQDLDGVVDDIFVFRGALSDARVNAIRNLRLSVLNFSPVLAAELFTLFESNGSGMVGGLSWSPRAGMAGTPGSLVDLGPDGTGVILDDAGNGLAGIAVYSQNFDGFDDGSTDLSDGSTIGSTDGTAQVLSETLRLTDAASTGTRASFRTPSVFDSSGGWLLTLDYTLTDAPGGNPPADGFSVNYGAIPARTGGGGGPDQDGAAEEGWGGGIQHISFEVDTWMNVDTEQGTNVAVNGSDIGFNNGVVVPNDGSISGTMTIGWYPNFVSYTTTGIGGPAEADFQALRHTLAGDDSFVWGISARTGGATETLVIDNLRIVTDATDSDGDGLRDVFEVAGGLDPNDDGTTDVANGPAGDPDGDTLDNATEHALGSNPNNNDTDGDGLTDEAEVNVHGSDPTRLDSDSDGLSDGDEVNVHGTDPGSPDTDSDGMDDGFEVANGLNPLADDSADDLDGDSLINVEEFNRGTNPNNVDTDGDGLWDAAETNTGIFGGYDFVNNVGDTGTDPLNPDSDGGEKDAATDGEETFWAQELGLLRDPNVPDYPAAATVYSQDFEGYPDGTTKLGDRSQMVGTARVVGGALELTTNTNSNVASFHIDTMVDTNLGFAFVADYTIEDTGSVGTPPADGWSFSAGALPYGQNSPQAEEGYPGSSPCLSFEMDTWMNGDAEVGPAIGFNRPLNPGGSNTAPSTAAFTNGNILDDESAISGKITIVVDSSGQAKFNTTGALTNAAFDVATGYSPDDTHTFAFAARTGGANERVTIDNIFLATDPDSDGDGLLTIWEIQNGLDPNDATGDNGAAGDPDGDGADNTAEQANDTDPQNPDTDNDGLLDGVETNNGTYVDPTNTGTNPKNPDSDGDGFEDGVETNSGVYLGPTDPGTDPNKVDTDGDGFNDPVETNTGVYNGPDDPGTDPNNGNTDGDSLDDRTEASINAYTGRNPNVGDDPAPSDLYAQDFNGVGAAAPDGATELGDGSSFAGNAQVFGGALQLTTNTNSNNSAFHAPAVLNSSSGFMVRYDYTIIDNTGNPPADGYSLSYGPIPPGSLSAQAEEGFPGVGVLSFEVDTWMVGDPEVGPAIGVSRPENPGGSHTAPSTAAFTNGPILNDETSISGSVTIEVQANGLATFLTTGAVTNAEFEDVVTNFTLEDAFTFAFAARTGGANEEVLIDNLSILAGLSDFDSWQTFYFGDPPGPNSGYMDDFENDGVDNGFEHAYGLDPTVSDNNELTVTDGTTFTRGTPVTREPSGTDPFTLRYVRRADGTVNYTVQFSNDMSPGSWIDSSAAPVVVADDGSGYQVVEVPYPFFLANGRKARFWRMVVSTTP